MDSSHVGEDVPQHEQPRPDHSAQAEPSQNYKHDERSDARLEAERVKAKFPERIDTSRAITLRFDFMSNEDTRVRGFVMSSLTWLLSRTLHGFEPPLDADRHVGSVRCNPCWPGGPHSADSRCVHQGNHKMSQLLLVYSALAMVAFTHFCNALLCLKCCLAEWKHTPLPAQHNIHMEYCYWLHLHGTHHPNTVCLWASRLVGT